MKFCWDSSILRAAPRSYIQTLDVVRFHLTPLEMCAPRQLRQRTRRRQCRAVEHLPGWVSVACGCLSSWPKACEAPSALTLNPVLAMNKVGPCNTQYTHSNLLYVGFSGYWGNLHQKMLLWVTGDQAVVQHFVQSIKQLIDVHHIKQCGEAVGRWLSSQRWDK